MSKKYYVALDDYERGRLSTALMKSETNLSQIVNTQMQLTKYYSKFLTQNKRNSKWFIRRLNYGKIYL